MPDRYREAASILVLRPERGGGFRFLLLHKPRKNDAWQLPQGGVEARENDTEAALRELREEAGIDGCTLLGRSDKVYQYDFPPAFRRFRPDNVCGQHIAYVFALAAPDTDVHVDGKEVDSFAWVTTAELPRYIQRKEYVELVKELYEEAIHLVT